MTGMKPGPKPKPLEMPQIPEQACPAVEGLTWYITTAKHADGIKDLVKRLQGQGYAAWCPWAVQHRTHARKPFLQLVPLFSPLFFVGLQVDQGLASMTKTIGVVDVMRSDTRRPLTISGMELVRLWEKLEGEGGAKMLGPVVRQKMFKEGDAIRVTSGHLADEEGIFSWCRGERVKILLDYKGKRIHVETTLDKLVRA